MLFLPLENKIHIFAPPCNILYVRHYVSANVMLLRHICDIKHRLHDFALMSFDASVKQALVILHKWWLEVCLSISFPFLLSK